ncbi:U11/U12 small nuclear ribonucleoprotein [Thalictrum thalictroides]|uniref:U11/U12 small nuclear ribonucleoprotein n=1 Tax=Thalictrum thalictroides TaxID=46969 RepID=A0A7J6W935_THATH|nr:U11/U12 small nuclear ribonucleoprotein [Thalictrum thalictroides]
MELANMKSEEELAGGGYNTNAVKKARLQSTLSALLEDPILSDVPKKPTLTEVDTLISLELGSAMKLSVAKMDGTSFDVAVLNSGTVKDLKLAIKKKTNEIEQSKMGHRHISWSLLLSSCSILPRSFLWLWFVRLCDQSS